MAQKTNGNFDFAFNFEVNLEGPLDARLTVETLTDLSSVPLKYDGMIVSVVDDTTSENNGVYYYLDSSQSWTKILDTGGTFRTPPEINIDAQSAPVDITSRLADTSGGILIIQSSNNTISVDFGSISKTVSTEPFEIYHADQVGFVIDCGQSSIYSVFDQQSHTSITALTGQFVKLWYNSIPGRWEYLYRSI